MSGTVSVAARGKPYRLRDDNNEATLSVIVDDDGDVHVHIADEREMPGSAQCEFTAPGTGGGRHPGVVRALRALADAMAAAGATARVSSMPERDAVTTVDAVCPVCHGDYLIANGHRCTSGFEVSPFPLRGGAS